MCVLIVAVDGRRMVLLLKGSAVAMARDVIGRASVLLLSLVSVWILVWVGV